MNANLAKYLAVSLILVLLVAACQPASNVTPQAPPAGTTAQPRATSGAMPYPAGTVVPSGTDLATCVVGSWELTDFRAFFTSLSAAQTSLLQAQLSNVEGMLVHTFNTDGTAVTKADNWTATFSMAGQTVNMLLNGTGNSTYKVSGDQIIGTPAAGSELGATLTVNGQPFNALTPRDLGAPTGISGTFNATCAQNTLSLTPVIENLPAGTTLQPMVLTRTK